MRLLLPITITIVIIKCCFSPHVVHALSTDSATTSTTRGISAQATTTTTTTTTTAHTTAQTTNDSIAQVESIMQMLHDTEIAGGKDSFSKKSNNNDNDSDDEDVYYNWSDDDFISHNIGGDGAGGNAAGTDATYIQNSDQMFESQNPILSKEECFDIIQEARDTIAQGLLKEQEEEEEFLQNNNNSEQGQQQQQQQRASAISNSQLGEARYVGIGVCVCVCVCRVSPFAFESVLRAVCILFHSLPFLLQMDLSPSLSLLYPVLYPHKCLYCVHPFSSHPIHLTQKKTIEYA